MILNLEGNINRYYAQTLCMVFFPGATFGEKEERSDDVPEVTISVYNDKENNSETAYASIRLNDRVSEATETVSHDEEITFATHASIAVGRALFAAGKELLGHIPPWGILTGIRPAKVASGLLASGKGIFKTRRILRDEYFLNPQKAALATSVASNENKLMKKIKKNGCSIYISIPFCPSRCAYCSFVSSTTPRLLAMIDEYLDWIIEDLKTTVALIKKLDLPILSVYIGGGTPTTLNGKQLKRLLKEINAQIPMDQLYEFTLEAGRPDTITAEKLTIAKNYGVTRISVNPQTLNNDVLREIGRKHTTKDFYRAFRLAKKSGIRDINVDLIAGLPGDDFKSFSESVDKIIELEPTNITIHTFCVKKAADILKNNSNIYSIASADAAKGVSYSQLKAKFAGYKPYYMYRQKNTVGNLENVGFSREGHEGLYNIFMMEDMQTIFGIGASAVTKLVHRRDNDETVIERIFNPKYPYEYLRQKKGEVPTDTKKAFEERVTNFYAKI
ncbi:MAG: coproporphyrinogen dehydrogenase HemZ [Clostridia bacterium]|nr:coproporphyrinogen dehydrogenase HemZ [Clostridia bacterium]